MKNQKLDLGNLGVHQAYEELFMNDEGRAEARKPKVDEIPLEQLTEFPNHPFKVRDGEEMQRMTESIRDSGVLVPALARPKEDGGYELISGHRRFAACRALGLETMPVIVRQMTDDEAVINMVDANLQREHILPSEKAFAYKMKLEALNHQGKTSGQLGQKWTRDSMADDSNDSSRQIQRYIRLTYLIPELLQQVDDSKIAFNPAVELSYLLEQEQRVLLDAMALNDCTPSHAQSIKLKKLSLDGLLSTDAISEILSEPKPNQQEQYKFRRDDIRRYFPASYTDKQVYEAVFKALELLKRQRERDSRDER